MGKTTSATMPSAGGDAEPGAILLSIVENGVLAGLVGASVVALWFMVLDVAVRGMPFFTPTLLGSIIFAGKEAAEVTAIDGAAIFAYTGLHGILFLAAGTALASMFYHFEHNPQAGFILLLLFVTFEAILWGLGVTVIPALAGAVGAWAILVANVGSAAAMFAFLLQRHPRALRSLAAAWNE